MNVCEGSVIRAYDSDQLWFVLKVTPHGILALGGTVQEFELLRRFETDGAQWTQLNIGDWQNWSAIAVSGVHRTFVRRDHPLKPETICEAEHNYFGINVQIANANLWAGVINYFRNCFGCVTCVVDFPNNFF